MVGLSSSGPLMRAYSIASANHDEHLEFLSIKVPDGPLTSRLQNVRPGDEVLVSRKPTGTLLLARSCGPACGSTCSAPGTGAAPFMSIIQDPEASTSASTRSSWSTACAIAASWPDRIHRRELTTTSISVSRFEANSSITRRSPGSAFLYQGRVTSLIECGKSFKDTGMPPLDPAHDRVMICGSPAMLADLYAPPDARGFEISPHVGEPGDYVIERSFVARVWHRDGERRRDLSRRRACANIACAPHHALVRGARVHHLEDLG